MSFVHVSEILMTLLCCAVLVQTMRLMRALRTLKDGSLSRVIDALDHATGQARMVLAEMKTTLTNAAATSKVVADGRHMAEELGVMIGIADASAERLLEAASASSRTHVGDEAPEREVEPA